MEPRELRSGITGQPLFQRTWQMGCRGNDRDAESGFFSIHSFVGGERVSAKRCCTQWEACMFSPGSRHSEVQRDLISRVVRFFASRWLRKLRKEVDCNLRPIGCKATRSYALYYCQSTRKHGAFCSVLICDDACLHWSLG